MKLTKLLYFIFVGLFGIMLADQLPKEHNERVEEMAKEGYNIIDSIFEQAHTSIVAKEDIMNPVWFENRQEISKIRNILSDAYITLQFDQHIKNPIPEMLETYLQSKVREELAKIFSVYGISIKDINNFYELSHIVCALSEGRHCGRMIREIKNENFDLILKLKIQKIARKQLRKDEARQLRETLVFGARKCRS